MNETSSASLQEKCQQIISQLISESGHLATISIGDDQIQLNQLDQTILEIPSTGVAAPRPISKRQVLQYFVLIAPKLLPLLKDRPITVKSYPDGLSGPATTQRHFSAWPEFVETVEMYSEYSGDNEQFVLCQNLQTLLWLVNQNVLEIYPWQSKITPDDTKLPTIFINSSGTLEMSVANYPDLMVFNLSPSQNAALQDLSTTTELFDVVDQENRQQSSTGIWEKVKESAVILQEYLSALGISNTFIKTSGRGGLHVVVPLIRTHTYDRVKQTAHQIGQQLVAQQPDLLTMEWQLNNREGKVFIDCGQNVRNKSVIAAYCLRPNRLGAISMPVAWKELEHLQTKTYTITSILEAIEDIQNGHEPSLIGNPW